MTPYDEDLIIKIVLACIFGIIIGYDRQRSHKPAGIRTQMLICIGSALLSGMSVHLAEIYAVPGIPRPDPARLMAQIITGIGFIGAGVIIKGNHRISGVTTAATIWATAAVGIAVGAGFYLPAIATTILVLLLQPLADVQYKLGLKYSIFVLKIDKKNWEQVTNILDACKIKHKTTLTSQQEVRLTVDSSEEKKRKMIDQLNKSHINFEIFDFED